MKFSGLMKLIKSRSGVLSVLVAILSGLMLGLIACHLYNLKKVEGFEQNNDHFTADDDNFEYKFNINFDDNDKTILNQLKHKLTGKKPSHPAASHPAASHPAASHPAASHPAASHPAAVPSHQSSNDPKNKKFPTTPGTSIQMNANSLNDYYNKLPQGVKKNDIPEGQEDLYILKSEIVPPVCPACPTFNCPREKPCPPCPSCERCPEPAFECKKVPNYNVSNVDEYLPSGNNFFGMSQIDNNQPRPVLNDFSQFN